MRGNMVINRSDAKKRKKEGEMLDKSLPESPKRTKVHAQRKFAQGSNLSSPTMTPVKDKDKSKTNGSVSSSELIPSKRPKTEDFLTFLCLRGTPILPPRLDFFNLASVPDGQDDEQLQPIPESNKDSLRNKTVPLHYNSKLTNVSVPIPKSSPKLPVKATEKKTDSCDLSSSGISRKSEKAESKENIVKSGSSANKRSTTAVQALKKKYQEQRLAKQRGNALSKLVQIVKEKSMMRTRSSASSESIHLSGKSQPVVKLEKLSKSKILRKTTVKASISPKKEHSVKKEISTRIISSVQRVTRSIVLSKEYRLKPSNKVITNNKKGTVKYKPNSSKRNSLRSHGNLPHSEEENMATRRGVARVVPSEKKIFKPKDSVKSQVETPTEKKPPKPKSPVKATGKEFASSLSDFSSDDDQPLVKKSSKMSLQNERRTKLVKKALKRIVMKNRKSSRMTTRSQQYRPLALVNRNRISHRPTRKTKEAATVFMELIGKKWTSPEEDNAEDDLVALVNFPDIRKINRRNKNENDTKVKTSHETSKKELSSSKEKVKSTTKPETVLKKVTDTKEKSEDDVQGNKVKKNPKASTISHKIIQGKQNNNNLSQRERLLREKMRRNAGKVICNKSAHSKCITDKIVGKKAESVKKKIVHQVQTRTRSLRKDSSDEATKKQSHAERDPEPENKAMPSRMTRQSFKGPDESSPKLSKTGLEGKEESKSKSSATNKLPSRMYRPLRKAATKSITFHPRSNSSQSEEKYSDSDEEPLGRKLMKNVRQSVGVHKSQHEKKEQKQEVDEKPKETGKKVDDKGKESSKKADEKSKEATKKIDGKSKEVANKADDKTKDATKKGDDKHKEVHKKLDDINKDAGKKTDEKSKDSNKKGDEKLKDTRKSDEKVKEVNRRSEGKIKDSAKKCEEKSRDTSRRSSTIMRNAVEDTENETNERSTRARSSKISSSTAEPVKSPKTSTNNTIGEKSHKPDGVGEKSQKPVVEEALKELETGSGKKVGTGTASDEVNKRVTRNDKPSKVSEVTGKTDDKSGKKSIVEEGVSENMKKSSSSARGKGKESPSSVSKEDHGLHSPKVDSKRPIDSSISDGNHANETGQSDSKKLKGSATVESVKLISEQSIEFSEENSSGKVQSKLVVTEKFISVGSKVDEALKSMKKAAVSPLISDTEIPVELLKIDNNPRKKPTNSSAATKKEQSKQSVHKKIVGSIDSAGRCREPVEVRCDKMCEKSKMFSIEKQAHGGLVLVKKVISDENDEDVAHSSKVSDPLTQASSSLNIAPRKGEICASGSKSSINVLNIPGKYICSCKTWIPNTEKSMLRNLTPCPLHGELSRVDHAEQVAKDVESPSKDSRKSSDDVANAESLLNTSAFGTDVDSFNDIECADSEVRRKVSKTVEEIEKWLLVSDIINSGKIPDDKDKQGECDLEANRIEFDNIRASMLEDQNAMVIDSDNSIKQKKPSLNKQMSKTLESVEKGIGIPLETFYNRSSQKSKVSDSVLYHTQKVKEEKNSSGINAAQSGSKLMQVGDSVPQKGGRAVITKNKAEPNKLIEASTKLEEKVAKSEPEIVLESKEVILLSDSPPPKVKVETKKSPIKDKTVVTSNIAKKTSSLRNFRIKPAGKLKGVREEKTSVFLQKSVSTSPAGDSAVTCSQISIKSLKNEFPQAILLNEDVSSVTKVISPTKSEGSKSQSSASERVILTSTPEKKPIFIKGGSNFVVRKPKERVVRRTPSIGAFSPENESSVYAFETEDREAAPACTPFRRKTKDGGTNTSPNKQHHRHSSSSSESSSFVCSDVGSPSRKSISSDILHSSKSVTPENSICGALESHLDTTKNPTCTTSIAIQVNLDESLTHVPKSPPISVPIYIPSSSREIGLSTSSSPLVLVPETRSTECSTQTDSSENNQKLEDDSLDASVTQKQPHTSEGHLFYIPLRPTPLVNQGTGIGSPSASIAANQLIRGVAVKLGTEGPTGPNQRVIMHAELVTDPPPFGPTIQCQTGAISASTATFSSDMQEVKGSHFVSGSNRSSVQHIHPAVVNLPSDPKHMCHSSILPISVVGPAPQTILTQQQSPLPRPLAPPPVGTVQPTTRPRPPSSGEGTVSRSCVSSTQTDNVKSDASWTGPSTVAEQPKAAKTSTKLKENASATDNVSAGPSCSKASTSSTKRSQPKGKGRGSGATAAGHDTESSSASSSSVPLVSLTNHPNPMATFPAPGSPSRMVEAPTFHPTEKEFQDPMEFIERIRPVAEKFGLCRVVPPPNFKPDCQVSDDMRFTAYNQYVHKMLHRWGPNVKEMMVIKKYLKTQSISLTHPPWIGGMEVDLPRLYQTVQSFGGLKEVIEKKKWQRVADGMRIPKLAQDRVTKLDDIYCKYLLPYDTLSPDERQKLFDDIEKEWGDRENQPLNLEGQGNDDDSEGDGTDEFDECIVKGRSMALNAFYRIARNTMATWFRQPEPSASDVETEYWRHVTTRSNHVCVHSGSIDSSVWGYGFPCSKGSPLARHPWNLKIFTNNSGSILRSMGPVMGVTVPTLHVGMLFTTCCWYRDPHGLPWVEYLHTGASKIWYSIPDSQSTAFRSAMTKLVPRYCKNKTIWLPSDTAMVPPTHLVKNGVSLCRTIQEPGQFILVFPRAFTSSICTGYLVSESVYFSQPNWLSTAEEVFKDIQDSCEPSMFSLERFLFRIATDTKSHVDVLKQVLPMIFRIRENELERRKQLFNLGLKSSERLPQQTVKRNRKGPRSTHDDDGDYECEVCRANLYVSLVRIELDEKQKVTDSNEECVYCLQHAIELLTKKKNHVKFCKLLYTYDQSELNDMIQKLLERIETKTQKKSQSKHGAFSR